MVVLWCYGCLEEGPMEWGKDRPHLTDAVTPYNTIPRVSSITYSVMVVLRWCYDGVMMVLCWCYDGVMLVL
jgi:hypothetical protein